MLLSIMLLLLLLLGLLHTDWGQNFLVTQVTKRLSRDLQSRISINNVEVGFFNRMSLGGVLVEDQKRDTLLYAGAVQVRITDWFFLQKEAELKFIGLEDALVKMQRTDSVWNYQFLQDYFTTPGTNKQQKNAGIDFDLKKVELRNISIIQKDGWIGRNMTVRVGQLDLDANEISLAKKKIDINSLALVKPYLHLFDYTGARPDSLKPKAKPAAPNEGWNADGWLMALKDFTIENGTFRTDRDSLRATVPTFDGAHILFSKITGNVKDLRMERDTIKALVNLSTKERSGFTVNKLAANFRMHPQLMEFSNMELRTPKSLLGNYYAMEYPSIASMSDYIHAVTMVVRMRNSTVHSDDLAFFAPALRTWNRNIKVSGNAKGTVDDLSAQNLAIQAGANTYVAGDVSLVGLPDIASTFINLETGQLRTTYTDALDFVPQLRGITTPNLRQLQYLRFNGNFTGFINDFVTFGTLETALGTVVSDLNMKLPAGGSPVYSGSVSTSGFRLGTFLNDANLGAVSFAGNVQGRGFAWNTLNARLRGNIRSIQYQDYRFQNITVDGTIARRKLDGNFIIDDPNADIRLSGIIDLGSKVPVFNANADIKYANLRLLGLTGEDLVLSGLFDLDFRGKTLNDFYGDARIRQASLLLDGQPLPFDSLTLSSRVTDGFRTLRATSNELEASIQGNFDLKSLPDAFLLFLNRYYPSYIRPPRFQLPRQAFTFDIRTGVVEDYLKLLDRNLTGFNNSQISGSLNLDSNMMKVELDVPLAGYQQYSFTNFHLTGDGDLERLKVQASVANAVISDSLNFPQTDISLTAQNDLSDLTVTTMANQTINKAELAAQVQTFADGFKVLLRPSSFVINGKTWNAEEGGELDFRERSVVHGQVVLRESDQEIRLTTQPSDIGSWNDLVVALNRVNLGDLSPLLVKGYRIEGLISGTVTVEDPQQRLNVVTDLRTEALRVDNDSIGQVLAAIAYNNTTGMITGGVNNLNPDQQVTVDLSIDVDDSTNLHRDRITVNAKDYPVKILERFIGTLFSDLQGFVTGKLDILGEGANRAFVGRAAIRDAGLKVNFTQVFYKLDNAEIVLHEDYIDFGTIRLRDRLGNTATMQGTIQHQAFNDMVFDIAVQTGNQPMELLNTTYADNQTFYGRAMGTGSFLLNGPQNDILMNIDMVASDRDSAYITLPPSKAVRESGTADFLVERKYGREMNPNDLRGAATNLSYQVNLTANPLVNIEVILDELTGDIIRGRGTGTLFISSGTNEPLSIRGRYDIQEGNYLFTFQSVLKKPFTIRPGGNNYIDWTGDPFGATVRLEAVYKADEVSFAPLAQSGLILASSGGPNLASFRDDVNVVALLTGELFRPQFSFSLELPSNLGNEFSYAIQQIEKNPNELNKQVTSLIVFNSFAPFGIKLGTSNQINELAYNTISGLLFGEVNKQLNQLLGGILQKNDVTLNLSGSVYNRSLVANSSNFNINQTDVNLSVGKAFFDERFTVTFGSTLNVPLQSTLQQTIQFLPDVTAEWVINKSGTIRATFFYRQNLDFLGSGSVAGNGLRTTRTGTALSYRREFDSIREFLFGRKSARLRAQAARDSIQKQDSAGAQ
ncbi:translocation/assembly module TamB domain-containing protein [Paracnuella aquatica]|uniref:translocation/assembly module TamB domain-containing protein n=1 Tax=Paracnuella aquatica TaxID=2268757 RepID=UPI000F4EE775|nr:translocation/assembly module TamB domain-containing protein [Paracnuella aquatica]RPD51924.1 hypothetical protein DRJ53_04400 [Paracnuella aquatica]